MVLQLKKLNTPLGDMEAIGDDKALYLLEFFDHHKLEAKKKLIQTKTQRDIIPGNAKAIMLLEHELNLYFQGELWDFTVPLVLLGTAFQQRVWEELQKIPVGTTRSYASVAQSMGHPTAHRAVAQANSVNRIPILIPCHRVIQADGSLGGYSSGLSKKMWLLNHENSLFSLAN